MRIRNIKINYTSNICMKNSIMKEIEEIEIKGADISREIMREKKGKIKENMKFIL